MFSSLLAIALLGGALQLEEESSFGFDRVDILAEAPGTWINYDIHYFGAFPMTPSVRFLLQLKPVWRTPVQGLYIGTSLQSISADIELPMLEREKCRLSYSLGLQTRFLLPNGLTVGVSWRQSYFRVGAGLSLLSTASWSNPRWNSWAFLPTIGIGVGRKYSLSVAGE